MYFHHYMLFALLNVCYCHQRPHYVTIRNPESHEGRGKKQWRYQKWMIVWTKKSFSFFMSENRDMSNTVTLFVGLVLWCFRFELNIRASQMCFKGCLENTISMWSLFSDRCTCTRPLCFNWLSLTDAARSGYYVLHSYSTCFGSIRCVTTLI